jgi:hypothetical protein
VWCAIPRAWPRWGRWSRCSQPTPSVATAFTDMYGRYRIANLVPGSYRVRATAALFIPAMRTNLQLRTGMRATVDLTLSMLLDPTAWLPACRASKMSQATTGTGHCAPAANRPMLRMLGDGEVVSVSAAADGHSHSPVQARVAAMGGNGGFGAGGIHSVMVLDRPTQHGTDWILRAGIVPVGVNSRTAVPLEIDAGYGSDQAFVGHSRLVMSYASHPELISNGATNGLQVMRMASARKLQLGDAVDVEAGGTVYAIHTSETVLQAQPFLKVTVHPGEVWAVRYRLATSREVQDFAGLDSLATDLPVAAISDGQLSTEQGTHQELALSRKIGHGSVEAVAYHDVIARAAVAGTGTMSPADLAAGAASSGVVVDTATGNFRFLSAGYAANGVSLMVSEPLAPNLWALMEFATGTGLSANASSVEQLPNVSAGLKSQAAQTATVALQGQLRHLGTELRVSYRWQQPHLVTAVDPYRAGSNQGYVSFYVRQSLRWGDRLPPGLEATVDVTNLLAEGYQPFLSADGRTLFLAQSPRTVEGGLSFTF